MRTINTIVLLLLGMSLFAQNTFIAHGGASYLAPENTLASAKLAWELGADAVELDVHLSKDNRVMVIHDKDTKRTCTGKKNLAIAQTPSVLLRDLDAGSWKGDEFKGEKIPFLGEEIDLIPEGKKLVIEIKCGEEVIPELIRCIEKRGKQDQIIFIALDWKTIVTTQNAFPENKCYWLSASKAAVKKHIKEAAAVGLAGINLDYSIIDDEVMRLAKENNLEVLAWTVDNPEEAKRLTALGVSGLTTNRPKWLKEEMGK